MPLKFSIVIPSYMQATWLESCLKSVLGQQGVELEAIVMDGGSTDGSKEIIERYASRLAYWQSCKDGGQSAAIRAGFARATGDVFAWLNSDDVYMPNALAKVSRFFESHPGEEVVTGGSFHIDGAGNTTYPWTGFRLNHTLGVAASHRRFLYYSPMQGVWQPSTFWRRVAYEAVGGMDPQFHYCMDFDLFTRLSKRRRFAVLPEMLSCFRWHDSNKSHMLMDTYHREIKIWAAKYGVERVPWWFKRAIFARYHVPVGLRAIRAVARERLGLVKLDAPRW